MNRQNFDANSVSNYPITIDRMAELQDDVQVPLKVLAGMLPLGGGHDSCIVGGCEGKGQPGYVLMKLSDGNSGYVYEVIEVRSGSSLGTHLKLVESQITAENSDGDTVVVRVERYLTWEVGTPASGTYVAYADLPRVWMKTAAQSDTTWLEVPEGSGWLASGTGQRLRMQRTGGRIHLWGEMAYSASTTIGGGGGGGGGGTLASSVVFRLPQGSRPSGDIVVPMRYNGVAACAVLASNGQLLLGRDTVNGDTLKIDTYIEI